MRWDPDAGGHLQQAALALYLERGYAEVTVAEIAAVAGLTKRTFFRYFADKREVLFAGSQTFQDRVIAAAISAPAELAPVDAAVAALAEGGAQLAQYRQSARARRRLIASSAELQERELIKMAAVTSALATALHSRGANTLLATLSAHAAVTAFTTAYDRWIDADGADDLPALLQHTLEALRAALHPA